MDARDFFRERKRMHEYYYDEGAKRCGECPMRERIITAGTSERCERLSWDYPQEIIETVERWSIEHPCKTQQNEFLKMFPRARLAPDGVLKYCPQEVDSVFPCPMVVKKSLNVHCVDCRKEFWLAEIEDDEAEAE